MTFINGLSYDHFTATQILDVFMPADIFAQHQETQRANAGQRGYCCCWCSLGWLMFVLRGNDLLRTPF